MAILNKMSKEALAAKDIPGYKTKVNEVTNFSYGQKSRNFIASTIEELKKAQWPTFGYVIRWSFVIVIFVTIFAVFLGYSDTIYKSTYLLTECSARVKKQTSSTDNNATGTSDTMQICLGDYAQRLVLRK
jgi:preprotein translocase SecE subunit